MRLFGRWGRLGDPDVREGYAASRPRRLCWDAFPDPAKPPGPADGWYWLSGMVRICNFMGIFG